MYTYAKVNECIYRDSETIPNTKAKILFLLYLKMSHLQGKHHASIHRPFGGLTGKMNSALKSGNTFLLHTSGFGVCSLESTNYQESQVTA